MSNKQDKRWLDMAALVSSWSEDASTKVGAVIVDLKRKNLLEIGWNGIPRGIKLTKEMQERPEKYNWFEHAERNAIYNAAYKGNSIKGSTLYCTLYPCPECARAIIQSGITEVVVKNNEDWKPYWVKSAEMLTDAGITVRIYE